MCDKYSQIINLSRPVERIVDSDLINNTIINNDKEDNKRLYS